MKKNLALLTLMVLLVTALVPMAASAGAVVNTTAYVVTANRGSLNVRANADAYAEVLDVLNYGTQVTVVEYIDNIWARILYVKSGRTNMGYVMNQHLSYNKPSSSTNTSGSTQNLPSGSNIINTLLQVNFSSFKKVTPYKAYAKPTRSTGWVNMRWAPGTNFDVIQRCYQNHELIVLSQSNSWAQVLDPKNMTVGFMDRTYLRTTSTRVTITVR